MAWGARTEGLEELMRTGGLDREVADAVEEDKFLGCGDAVEEPQAHLDRCPAVLGWLEAAEVEQARQPEAKTINRAEVYAMIDYLGDVGAALQRGDPGELQKLYEALRLEMIYHAEDRAIDAAIRLGRDSERVRGPSCSLPTRDAA